MSTTHSSERMALACCCLYKPVTELTEPDACAVGEWLEKLLHTGATLPSDVVADYWWKPTQVGWDMFFVGEGKMALRSDIRTVGGDQCDNL